MKRILIAAAIAVCIMPAMLMGSLFITSPAADTSWKIWTYHDITWTWTGNTPDSFVIEWLENIPGHYHWLPIVTVLGTYNSYNWYVGSGLFHVPVCPYPDALVKIRVFDDGGLIDYAISDGFLIHNY